ncbi:hypothetical protein BEWA_042020 [Theileria equi strain WA]|uniref:Uncharacterized protein n=1 Tax=Theileria equi strain WA TaxID=1537102 RepID=L1LFW5_THEEQ|nr:hypothetical protein BEWA_042020 [Theileria equi strain WA]EKX74164.1 hypothetical protein BEWA_042020 [Theileria equi strain WA]|eukprot:XP_004833616.1 hypothetical protein BEWA_042020 [Theileria equi strain WA]
MTLAKGPIVLISLLVAMALGGSYVVWNMKSGGAKEVAAPAAQGSRFPAGSHSGIDEPEPEPVPAPSFGDLPELGRLQFLVKAGGSELETVVAKAPVVTDLKGFEGHTHRLSTPAVFAEAESHGRLLDGLPAEAISAVVVYFWVETPLLLRLEVAGTEGAAKKFVYFVNAGEHGAPAWELLPTSADGAALTDEELKAKLAEINVRLGNIGAANVSRVLDADSGDSYVVTHDGRDVTVSLAKQSNSSLGFTLLFHSFPHPSILGKLFDDRSGVTFPASLPSDPLLGLSVYLWNGVPLLIKLDFYDPLMVDNVYYVFKGNVWEVLTEGVDTAKVNVTRRLTNREIEDLIDKLNFDLSGFVNLHLDKKESYTHLSKANITVTDDPKDGATVSEIPTGYKRFSHAKNPAASDGTFTVGKYFYEGTLAYGLPKVPVKKIDVFFKDGSEFPLLIQALLPPAKGESSDRTVNYQNNGNGVWSEFSLDSVAVNKTEGNVTTAMKLEAKFTELKRDFGNLISLKIDGKVSYELNKKPGSDNSVEYIDVEIIESPLDFFGFSPYVHVLSHKTKSSNPDKVVVNDTSVFTVDKLTLGDQQLFGLQIGKASKMTVYWLNDKVPVLADVYDRATHKYFVHMNDGNRWALHGVFQDALDDHALSALLFTIRDKIGNPIDLDVGYIRDNFKYLTNGVTVKVEKTLKQSLEGYDIYTHTSSSNAANLKVGKLLYQRSLQSIDLSELHNDSVHKVHVYCKNDAPLLLEFVSKHSYFFFNNWDGSWSPVKFDDALGDKLKEKLTDIADKASKVTFLDLSREGEYTAHTLTIAVKEVNNNGLSGYKKLTHTKKEPTSAISVRKFVDGNFLQRGLPVGVEFTEFSVFKDGKGTPLVVEIVKPVAGAAGGNPAPTEHVYFRHDGFGVWVEIDNKPNKGSAAAVNVLKWLLSIVDNDLQRHFVLDIGNFKPYQVDKRNVTVESSEFDLPLIAPLTSSTAPAKSVKITKCTHKVPKGDGQQATFGTFRLESLEHNSLDLFVSELPLPYVESVTAFYKKDVDMIPLLVEVVSRIENDKKYHYFHVNKRGIWVRYVTLDAELVGDSLNKKLRAISERLGRLVTLKIGTIPATKDQAVYSNEDAMVTITGPRSPINGIKKYTHEPSPKTAAEDPDAVFTIGKMKVGQDEVGGLFFGQVVRAHVYFHGEEPILVEVYTGYKSLYFARDAQDQWWEEVITDKTFNKFLGEFQKKFVAEHKPKTVDDATSNLRGDEAKDTVRADASRESDSNQQLNTQTGTGQPAGAPNQEATRSSEVSTTGSSGQHSASTEDSSAVQTTSTGVEGVPGVVTPAAAAAAKAA